MTSKYLLNNAHFNNSYVLYFLSPLIIIQIVPIPALYNLLHCNTIDSYTQEKKEHLHQSLMPWRRCSFCAKGTGHTSIPFFNFNIQARLNRMYFPFSYIQRSPHPFPHSGIQRNYVPIIPSVRKPLLHPSALQRTSYYG